MEERKGRISMQEYLNCFTLVPALTFIVGTLFAAFYGLIKNEKAKAKKVEPIKVEPDINYSIVKTETPVHPKMAKIAISTIHKIVHYSYIKQEEIKQNLIANLTKGYLTDDSYSASKNHSDKNEYISKVYVCDIKNLVDQHIVSSSYRPDGCEMAHFIDEKGFRFQLKASDILRISVKEIIELKDETINIVDISLKKLNYPIKLGVSRHGLPLGKGY